MVLGEAGCQAEKEWWGEGDMRLRLLIVLFLPTPQMLEGGADYEASFRHQTSAKLWESNELDIITAF